MVESSNFFSYIRVTDNSFFLKVNLSFISFIFYFIVLLNTFIFCHIKFCQIRIPFVNFLSLFVEKLYTTERTQSVHGNLFNLLNLFDRKI